MVDTTGQGWCKEGKGSKGQREAKGSNTKQRGSKAGAMVKPSKAKGLAIDCCLVSTQI